MAASYWEYDLNQINVAVHVNVLSVPLTVRRLRGSDVTPPSHQKRHAVVKVKNVINGRFVQSPSKYRLPFIKCFLRALYQIDVFHKLKV